MKTVYFPAQGPRDERERELYEEAVRMMHNIDLFAREARPQAVPLSDQDQATLVAAAQPCRWESAPENVVEITAHAVMRVDDSDGSVVACHGLQADAEVDHFAFRKGGDGARLYDWTHRDGGPSVHVYGLPSDPDGILVIVKENA